MTKKYIDAEKLIAEIEKLMECVGKASRELEDFTPYMDGELSAYEDIIDFLSDLEESEKPMSQEGLENEYKDYVESDPVYSKLVNRNAGLCIARHFYELGLNARKEE